MERKITAIAPKKVLVPKRKNVAAYARVSSGKDAMLHSLSAQISYYNSYIQQHGDWCFAGVYADEALTGTKDNRPEFQRMIADCKAGEIDMIITKSISRFARNTVTLLETVRGLKALGVDVYFEEQNIHSMSGDGELMLAILASFAQEESLSASENVKWRIRNDFKQGKLPLNFKQFYGYSRTADGDFEIVKKEAEVIQYIAKRYMDGLGFTLIARELNEQGIKSPFGGEWAPKSVKRMITSEKNIGDLLLQKFFRRDHITKKTVTNVGQFDRYYIEDNHEGIIEKELYNEIQQEISKRAKKNKCKESGQVYPFTGLIYCGNCGAHYRRKVSHCSDKYRRSFWNCSTYLYKGKSVCHTKQIPEEELYRLSCEVLGLTDFDETVFKEKIKQITVPEWNVVKFVFYNGETVTKNWNDRSRKWTDEMKAENYEKLRKGHKQ